MTTINKSNITTNQPIAINVGDKFKSNNYGSFEVIENINDSNKTNEKYYLIKFDFTGYTTIVSGNVIRRGYIRDPYYPRIFGVGCMGIINEPLENYKTIYNIWYHMLARCYNSTQSCYNKYGAEGITVDDRWLCFENFYYDFKRLPGYEEYVLDPMNYQLDKDILQHDIPKCNKVYSKDTCMLVHRRVNTLQMCKDNGRINGYQGVEKHGKMYRAVTHDSCGNFVIGSFNTEQQAASAYNLYMSSYYPYMPLNNVEIMSPMAFKELNLKKSCLCHTVQRELCVIHN